MNIESFLDELVKIGDSAASSHRNAYLAAGGLGGALLGAGAFLARKPMIRRDLGHFIKSIGRGGYRAGEAHSELPASVVKRAREIAEHLRSQGIDPTTARIAVAGTGGTGKSTMAKALSQELGMNVRHLDDYTKSKKSLGEFLKENPVQKGTIAEQTHLLSQMNPDEFDAIIRLSTTMPKLKSQLKHRGRGAAQWELYDYPLLHKTISNAFNLTAGAKKKFGPGVSVKVRPSTGFAAEGTIQEAARKAGVNVKDLDRQRALASLAANSRVRTPGLLPFVRKAPIAESAALTVGGGALGTGGAHYLSRRE